MMLLSGIDKRVSLPYVPQQNSVCERWVGIAKASIIKMLNGKADDWDLHLNAVQLAMNIKYSSLHKSRPFTVLFNRQPNDFIDYSKVPHTLSTEKADVKLINEKLKFAQEVVIPQITKRIKETSQKQHEAFSKKHTILEDMYPIGTRVMAINPVRNSKLEERWSGPFIVHGYTDRNAYILRDPAGHLLSRDFAVHHLRPLVDDPSFKSDNEFKDGHFEVQAIIDHRGHPGAYEYLVHWLGYDKAEDHTWQTARDFDSKYHINLYWKRRNSGKGDTNAPTINNAIRKKPNRDDRAKKHAQVIKRSKRLQAQQQTKSSNC
jgi:hypothetical protein